MKPIQPLLRVLRHSFFAALLVAGFASDGVGAAVFPGNNATGFGGPVGQGSLTLSDDGTTLTGTFTKGAAALNDNLVFYIDSQSGGFASTAGFADDADVLRRAISGIDVAAANRSTLTFPAGFTADYAIAIGPSTVSFGGVWSLANGGANSLGYIASVNVTPVGTANAATYTFSLPVSQLGLTANSGASFRILGTYISSTGFRSNEAIPGNVAGTQGWNAFSSSGDVSYPISLAVTNANDSGAGSLRQAVADVAAGGTIIFAPALSGQTCTLTSGQILLDKSLTIDASTLSAGFIISGNDASRVFEVEATRVVDLKALTIRNGYASGTTYPGNTGGGIYNSGTLSLTECTLAANQAILGTDPGGGGIENNSGSVSLTRCTVSGNSSKYGGGIENFPGTLILNQCTVANNSASLNGGGISGSGGNVTVNQSTISGNSAGFLPGSAGGGIGINGGTLNLYNSIVALNSATASPNISGSPIATGVNFTTGDPQLATLGNYGGRTQTMPPLVGSPVINAAITSTFTTDQRGLAFLGAPDIGAAEYLGDPVIANLINLWNQDADNDGSPYGVEYALGTNTAVSDRGNSRNLTTPTINGSGHAVLSFGLNSAAVSATRWILQRSPDLSAGSFTEVYRFNGTTDTNASGITVVRTANSVTITDANPPTGKGFYRFKAEISQ